MKSLHLFALTLGLLLSFTGSQALAQTRYEIEGVIYGPGTKPVGNITITLENRTRAQIALTFSDNDGRYHFSAVDAGVYYLVVKPNETQFQPSMQRVELIDTGRGGSNTSAEKVDFMLRPAPRKDAESVTPGVLFVQEVPIQRPFGGELPSSSPPFLFSGWPDDSRYPSVTLNLPSALVP